MMFLTTLFACADTKTDAEIELERANATIAQLKEELRAVGKERDEFAEVEYGHLIEEMSRDGSLEANSPCGMIYRYGDKAYINPAGAVAFGVRGPIDTYSKVDGYIGGTMLPDDVYAIVSETCRR